jgi:hypothetical protein
MPDYDSGPQALPEQQLIDIAAYVAAVAGQPQEQAGGTGTGAGTGTEGGATTPTTTSP